MEQQLITEPTSQWIIRLAVSCPPFLALALQDGCLSLPALCCRLAQVCPFFRGSSHQGLVIDQTLRRAAHSAVCVITVTITNEMARR